MNEKIEVTITYPRGITPSLRKAYIARLVELEHQKLELDKENLEHWIDLVEHRTVSINHEPISLDKEEEYIDKDYPDYPEKTFAVRNLMQKIHDYEVECILEAIERNNGNKTKAAHELGITKRILSYRIRHENYE